MSIESGLDLIWSSDFVQKNPKKSYRAYYPAEYPLVEAYLNDGPEPDFSSFSKLGKGLCEIEKERRGVTPPPPVGAGLSLPASFHIWGGSMDAAMSKFDIVISLDAKNGRPAYWRQNGNPNLIALHNPGVELEACPHYYTFAFTYGGALFGSSVECGSFPAYPGATDDLQPLPSGAIRGTDRVADSCACAQADGIRGFAVDKPATASWLRDLAWYGWKKYDSAAQGWNGMHSDNLFWGNFIKAGWFFGGSCPIVNDQWDQGLLTICQGLKQRGVPMLGGNGSYRTQLSSFEDAANLATDFSIGETLQEWINQGPDIYHGELTQMTAWLKAHTATPAYGAFMDIVPASDTARMRFGLALATITGVAYMPYDGGHGSMYLPAEMTKDGRRNYLGKPTSEPVRIGNVFSRLFEGGTVTANFDTKQGTFA